MYNYFMKILITGGHLTPALSLIDALEKRFKKDLEIIFVGRKYALEQEKTQSLEYKEITKRRIKFIPLQTGRLTRILTIRTIRSLFRVPFGFWHGWQIVKNERPDLIFSFGGYLALPIVFWGFIFRIPIYTHEQTIHPGLSNRLIGILAKKVFIAFDEAKQYFSKNKTIVTGNPIRKSVLTYLRRPRLRQEGFGLRPDEVWPTADEVGGQAHKIGCIKKDRPVIYITGGSLGSHSINEHIKKIIAKLLNYYVVIHQVGDTKEYKDYEYLIELKKKLPNELQNRYYVQKHFFEEEIGDIYSLADLVIGRAGANTFFELIALKKPAIFIPLPWAANCEQQKHAEMFKKFGVGEIFHQSDSSNHLLNLIGKMIERLDKYKKNFNSLKYLYKKNAAELIVKEIIKKN